MGDFGSNSGLKVQKGVLSGSEADEETAGTAEEGRKGRGLQEPMKAAKG